MTGFIVDPFDSMRAISVRSGKMAAQIFFGDPTPAGIPLTAAQLDQMRFIGFCEPEEWSCQP